MKSWSNPLLLVLLATSSLVCAALPPKNKAADPFPSDKKTAETFPPCQTRSPNSGSFFDLNPIHIAPPEPESSLSPSPSGLTGKSRSLNAARKAASKLKADRWLPQVADRFALGKRQHRQGGFAGGLQEKDDKEKVSPASWHARGQDYPSNFSMNFCGPVVEEMKDVVGLSEEYWKNISAFYTFEDRIFSLGNQNTDLTWRGRKLTLNYTGGSPCPKAGFERRNQTDSANWSKRQKSSLISLLCERDPLAAKASISFVGTVDECTYFFEARSAAACPAVQKEKQQVGPSGVFSLIAAITFLVYLLGGIVYQRAVMHQRGWRQLPNYSLWHGIFSFAQDVVLIGLSACSRCLGSAGGNARKQYRGFNQVQANETFEDGSPHGIAGRGRRIRQGENDENRLIDELDEEWHD